MPVKVATSVQGTDTAYEPPTLVKHGSLSALTLSKVAVSGGGGSPWEGIEEIGFE